MADNHRWRVVIEDYDYTTTIEAATARDAADMAMFWRVEEGQFWDGDECALTVTLLDAEGNERETTRWLAAIDVRVTAHIVGQLETTEEP